MIGNLDDFSYPILLDGGLSNALELQGHELNHPLWTAKLLASNPEAIIAAHLSYLKAGARCIITSSYQATLSGFMEMGFEKREAEDLLIKTVTLAEMAVNRYMELSTSTKRPIIAASIGPYGAYLGDGSEYKGTYGVSNAFLKQFHQERINLLDKTKADCFACETIPSFQEAKVLWEILQRTQKSAWISFSCKDDTHLHDGSKIQDCVALFKNHPNVFALGANCTHPKYINGIIKTIKQYVGNKKIIIYPNAGLVYDANSKVWIGTAKPEGYATLAKEWLNLGANIVGGCCQIGSNHIRQLQKLIS